MTILHVLKYPPELTIEEYLYTARLWFDIFPRELAEIVGNNLIFGAPPSAAENLRKILLEYDGPL